MRITLRSSELPKPRTITLARALIRQESVQTRLIEADSALVRVTQFDYLAPKRMRDGLAAVERANGRPLTNIVLDLRDCSGGLQDHKRASIVGTPTFGKGLVERILPLTGNSALKITTMSMHRPNGNALDGLGVSPDVLMPGTQSVSPGQSPLSLPDAGLEEALRILQAQ